MPVQRNLLQIRTPSTTTAQKRSKEISKTADSIGLCLKRLDVAEVFPNNTPDLFRSLFRILVQEDLDDMTLLRLES